MDFDAVARGLATAADAIAGLNCHAYPTAFTEPAFVVEGYTVDYDAAMARGLDEVIYTGMLYVGGDRQAAMVKLSGYLKGSGATSVKAALEADGTLGGTCGYVRLRGAQVDVYKVGDAEYLGAELAIEVGGSGT